jgi:DNA-binding winged helix-turn-helix (wHTH) protein
MSGSEVSMYEFGSFRLCPRRRLLTAADGKPIAVTPKAFDALIYLVERTGELVPRSALIEALWPDTVVEENNVYQAISLLRRILGEGFIVTLPGRGYQFVAEVRALGDAMDEPPGRAADTTAPPTEDLTEITPPRSPLGGRAQVLQSVGGRRPVKWVWVAWLGAAVALLGALLAMLGHTPRIAPPGVDRPTTFVVEAPEGSVFGWVPTIPEPAVSPDGQSLVFVAPLESRKQRRGGVVHFCASGSRQWFKTRPCLFQLASGWRVVTMQHWSSCSRMALSVTRTRSKLGKTREIVVVRRILML